MANEQYADQKRPLIHSKKQIDKAARKIRHGVTGNERIEAIEKIQEFREYHLYPLMLLKNHLVRTAKRISPKVVVARRLKQLSTIVDKLERPTLDGKSDNAIKLTRMQDIAGCRAIVKNPDELLLLKEKLLKSKSVHRVVNKKDYLTKPKASGYGGYHLIYSCYEGQESPHPWKKANVEIQLRTQLQHAWATSLEIIDTLEGIDLKTSMDGHKEWREFFELLGKLVSHDEKLCMLSENEYIDASKRVCELSRKLAAYKKLKDYSYAISVSSLSSIPKSKRGGKGLFLVLVEADNRNRIKVLHFNSSKSKEALQMLNSSEISGLYSTAVLVSAESIRSLRQAYPNYFGSTTLMIKFLTSKLEEENKRLAHKISLLKVESEKLFNEMETLIQELEKKSEKEKLSNEEVEKLEKLRELLKQRELLEQR